MKEFLYAQNNPFLARCLQGTGALATHVEMGRRFVQVRPYHKIYGHS